MEDNASIYSEYVTAPSSLHDFPLQETSTSIIEEELLQKLTKTEAISSSSERDNNTKLRKKRPSIFKKREGGLSSADEYNADTEFDGQRSSSFARKERNKEKSVDSEGENITSAEQITTEDSTGPEGYSSEARKQSLRRRITKSFKQLKETGKSGLSSDSRIRKRVSNFVSLDELEMYQTMKKNELLKEHENELTKFRKSNQHLGFMHYDQRKNQLLQEHQEILKVFYEECAKEKELFIKGKQSFVKESQKPLETSEKSLKSIEIPKTTEITVQSLLSKQDSPQFGDSILSKLTHMKTEPRPDTYLVKTENKTYHAHVVDGNRSAKYAFVHYNSTDAQLDLSFTDDPTKSPHASTSDWFLLDRSKVGYGKRMVLDKDSTQSN